MRLLASIAIVFFNLISYGQRPLIYFHQDISGRVTLDYYDGSPIRFSDFIYKEKCAGDGIVVNDFTITQGSVIRKLRSTEVCSSTWNATSFTYQNQENMIFDVDTDLKGQFLITSEEKELKIRLEEFDDGYVCGNGGYYHNWYYTDITFNPDSTINQIVKGELLRDSNQKEIPSEEFTYTYDNGLISEIRFRKAGEGQDFASQHHVYDKKRRLKLVSFYNYPSNIKLEDSMSRWTKQLKMGVKPTNPNIKRLITYTYNKMGLVEIKTYGENGYKNTVGTIHYNRAGLIDTFQQTNDSGEFGLELVYEYNKSKQLVKKQEHRGYGCIGDCGSLKFYEEYRYNKADQLIEISFDYLRDRLPKWTKIKVEYR